jgi:hypothetical protein
MQGLVLAAGADMAGQQSQVVDYRRWLWTHLQQDLPNESPTVRADIRIAILKLDESGCAGLFDLPLEERQATLLALVGRTAGGARQLACIEVENKRNCRRQLNLAG